LVLTLAADTKETGTDVSSTVLAAETWSACSMHDIALAFLRAERDKSLAQVMFGDRRIVDKPDLTDAVENNLRASLLCGMREPLLRLVPAGTRWFEVKHLRECHFAQLHAINHAYWNHRDDMNELDKIAVRKPQVLRGSIGDWEPPILWGHDASGPFTILEGNHRMSALAGSQVERVRCALPVYVGLSAELCVWHHPDVDALRAQGWQL
jgi:hypothetical protein